MARSSIIRTVAIGTVAAVIVAGSGVSLPHPLAASTPSTSTANTAAKARQARTQRAAKEMKNQALAHKPLALNSHGTLVVPSRKTKQTSTAKPRTAAPRAHTNGSAKSSTRHSAGTAGHFATTGHTQIGVAATPDAAPLSSAPPRWGLTHGQYAATRGTGGRAAPANAAAAANGTISGTITDSASHAAIPGACASLRGVDGGTGLSGCADSSGNYTISAVPPGQYHVQFTDNLHSHISQFWNNETTHPDILTMTSGATITGINAAMVQGGSISGTISSGGSPLSNVCATVYNDQTGNYAFAGGCADASGHYQTTGLAAGKYDVVFDASGPYVEQWYNNQTSQASANAVTVTVGTVTPNINASMVRAGSISGTITDATSHAGITACVDIYVGTTQNYAATACTDASGNYTSPGLTTGTYTLYAYDVDTTGDLPQWYNNKPDQAHADTVAVTFGSDTAGKNMALARGGSITGSVTDTSNTAIAGACATAWLNVNDSVSYACSDAGGHYTLVGIPTGSFKISFDGQQAGYLGDWYHQATSFATGTAVSVTQGSATTASTEKLAKGGSITGTVTDASSHAGLANIAVDVESSSGNGASAFLQTSSSGTYSAVGLPSDTYTVCFYDYGGAGYLSQCWNNTTGTPTPVTVTAPNATTGINAAMHLGGSVTGTVTDATTSTGIAGIDVQAVSTADGNVYAETGTAGDGTYHLVGLPAGTYKISFTDQQSDPIYLTQWYNGKATQGTANAVSVSLGATTSGINAALARGGVIAGAVTDATSHAAISGAEIDVYPATANPGDPSLLTTYSNRDGSYTATGLPTGHYKVDVIDVNAGHLPQWYNGKSDVTTANSIAVTAPNTTSSINVALARGATISGTVTDASTNAALGNVAITVTSSDGNSTYSAETAADGTYSVIGLPTGNYQVEFDGTANGYVLQWWNNKASAATATAVSATAPNTTAAINAHLVLGGSVTGTVTDAATHTGLDSIEVDLYDSRAADNMVGYAFTDSAGNYRITSLAAGTYYAEFSDQRVPTTYVPQWWNNQPDSSTATGITVTLGAATSGVGAAMTKAGSISGTVTDSTTGAPISGVCVNAFLASNLFNSVSSDCTAADGTYTLPGLLTGQYLVQFVDPTSAHQTQWYNGKPDSSTADVVRVNNGANVPSINASMLPGGWITGTVTDAATHSPISGVCVAFFNPATASYVGDEACTDDNGVYKSEGLPGGTYQVDFTSGFSGSSYAEQWYNNQPTEATANSVHVTVGSGSANIDAAMRTGPTISGTVTEAAGGTGLSDVCVEVDDATNDNYATSVCTAADGTYTTGGVLPGTYKVHFAPNDNALYIPQWYNDEPDFASADTITAASTPITGIDAALQTGGTIAGTITDAGTGDPLSGICVYVTGPVETGQGCSGADGTYETSAVPAGDYSVNFYDPFGPYLAQEYANEPVTVTSGARTGGVDAAMVKGATFSGTITDVATGAPLTDACATVTDTSGGWVSGQTCSDVNGHYVTQGVPAGTYKIDFTNIDGRYIEQWYSGQDTVDTATELTVALGTNTPGIDAAMQLGGIVTGRATTAGTHLPVPDVCVTLLKPADGSFGGNGGCTDDTGHYVSAAVRPGTYKVQFTDQTGTYAVQYYNRKPDLASADLVTVTAGSSTPNIDALLGDLPETLTSVCGMPMDVSGAAAAVRRTVPATATPAAKTAPGAQLAELTATGGSAGDAFGSAVAVSGSTAVVGAPQRNGGQGAAYVFTRKGTAWSQAAVLTATDGASGDGFGSAVAIKGGSIIVGAPERGSDQGAAYLFAKKGKAWAQAAELTPSGAAAGDKFGCSVADAGSTVAVGAIGRDGGQGGAFVFKKKGSSWSQAAELSASDGAGGDFFGASVGIGGSTIVVGAFEHAVAGAVAQGAAYVFKKKGNAAWNQSAELTASDGAAGDMFGSTVAVAGSTIAVGAFEHQVGSAAGQGSVYVFARKGTAWNQSAELHAPDGAAGDLFGGSVAISGSTLVVGARGHTVGTDQNRGAVYVFARKGTAWSQVAEPVATDGAANDEFGWSVAIQGKTVVAGAFQKSVNGNAGQGAAYVDEG